MTAKVLLVWRIQRLEDPNCLSRLLQTGRYSTTREEEKVRRGNPKSFLCRQGLNVISRMGRFVEYSVFGREVTCDWSIISITSYFDAGTSKDFE